MGRTSKPRSGSLGYRPRKRAQRETPKFRRWPESDEVKPLSFMGFKAGMTHVVGINSKKNTLNINQEVSIPVTVLEIPPMKCFGVRVYTKGNSGLRCADEVLASKLDKNLPRKIASLKRTKKTADFKKVDQLFAEGVVVDVRLLLHT
ncbi:MAG: 50S ribosomal protein L3, partial [Candidatus Diapherotrites archaeon]|nr:50S ribosomal protein L3 [Candidatus Diapherotrites archaeon]